MPGPMVSFAARAIERVCDALLHVATAAGILLTAFVALSSFMRYLMGQPFPFTEELVGLLFVAFVFLALPGATVRRRHIEVTLVTDLLSARLRRGARALGHVLVVVFCVWYGRYAWDFIALSSQLGSRSDIGGLLLWPWMALMLVAPVLMTLAVLALWGTGRLEKGEGETGA